VQLAEALGLDGVFCLPELDGGGCYAEAAPEVWLSALAARTRRLRLGWGLASLLPPREPPLRTAEQAAALDLASHGRLEVVLLPDRADFAEADGQAAWDEGLEMLAAMWRPEAFCWQSPRFSIEPVEVVPKPLQRPHPPLWLAGWQARHAVLAGEARLGFLDVSGAGDEGLEVHRTAFLESATRAAERTPRARAAEGASDALPEFAVATELDPGAESAARLEGWQALGFDHALVRIAGSPDAADAAAERIRFLAETDARVH
jgi:alkanesulfonate monooxygenase SsuD/methylene tetrahydromethanopterin reductase-like flavin-dependent oxidoreductase (luciferase family)